MIKTMLIGSMLLISSPAFLAPSLVTKPKIDTAAIETLTGLKGTYNEKEVVFKVTKARDDVKISVDKWPMPPFMGLTSWAAFMLGTATNLMVMGDLVLFEDEVNPVISAALDAGLDVTALHNHFFFDEPKVYFMHIAGEGTLEKLTKAVRACFDKIKLIRTAQTIPAKSFQSKSLPEKNAITGDAIEKIFGQKGQAKDGMFKVVIGREVTMSCGCKVSTEMGVNTWAAFAGSDDNAVVDGDFAILENELRLVLESLRSSGINIVAIHHHMIGESPRMIFLHYWGRGPASDLAKAIKNAINSSNLAIWQCNHEVEASR